MNPKTLSSIAMLPLLFTFSLSADPLLIAQWNWTDQDGAFHEYGAYNFEAQSWEASRDQVHDDWYLATITSRGEQESLIARLNGLSGEYWLGGSQANSATAPSDDWSWVTGEAWDYTHWAPGEANDYSGPGSEQYLAVWSEYAEDAWQWNDEGCLSNISGFIAERTNSVPEPGKLSLFALGWLAILGMVRRKKT